MRILIFIGLKLWEIGRVTAGVVIALGWIVGWVLLMYHWGKQGRYVLESLSFIVCVTISTTIVLEIMDRTFTDWFKRNWHRAGEIDKRRRA